MKRVSLPFKGRGRGGDGVRSRRPHPLLTSRLKGEKIRILARTRRQMFKAKDETLLPIASHLRPRRNICEVHIPARHNHTDTRSRRHCDFLEQPRRTERTGRFDYRL